MRFVIYGYSLYILVYAFHYQALKAEGSNIQLIVAAIKTSAYQGNNNEKG